MERATFNSIDNKNVQVDKVSIKSLSILHTGTGASGYGLHDFEGLDDDK